MALFACMTMIFSLLYSFRPGFIPYKKYFPGNSYEKEWKKVDSLETRGLTQSASIEVARIHEMAQKEHNTPQVVKSLLYIMKYRNNLEEEAFRKNFEQITREITSAPSPLREILYSIKGQMLWTYYQQNRYRYNNRSVVWSMEQDNVLTWDREKIIRETIHAYAVSVENSAMLKAVPLKELEDILDVKPSTRFLRPALYDFLSYRALDFFESSEPDLNQPSVTFSLEDAAYFKPGSQFSNMDVKTPDSLATKFYAVRILQGLVGFHQSDMNRGAYTDAEMRRLDFIRSYSVHPQKDSLYLQAMIHLKEEVKNDSAFATVCYKIASYYTEKAAVWNAFSPDQQHRDDYRKALQYCTEGISRYPESYGGKYCSYLKESVLAPSINITVEASNASQQPFMVGLDYRNTEKVYAKIVSVDYHVNKKEIAQKNFDAKQMVSYLLSQKMIKEATVELKKSEDYQRHSTQLPVQALSYGYYYVLVSNTPDFSLENGHVSYADFWVTDFAPLLRGNNNYTENELFLMEKTSGNPVEKAVVNIYMDKYSYTTRSYNNVKVGSVQTGQDGIVKMPFISSDYYNYMSYEIIKGKDQYVSRNGFYQYKKNQESETVKTTSFFLDRGIYRPGQVVYFKGLVTQTTGKTTKIIPNYTTKVYLYDANYQVKSELEVKTNEYGSYSGSFTIPPGELTGQWHIQDATGSAYFSVEEYKRPKFEVTFDTLKGNYRLNDQVHVKGLAKTYAGYGIDGATVTYRVTRNVSFPYWRGYFWVDYPVYSKGPQEILHGTTTTDEKGYFMLDFTALPDKSFARENDPYFTYTVTADVTDITGETRSSATYIYAGYTSMMINVSLPDQVSLADTNKYLITTTNLAGTETPAKGKITITKLTDFPRLMRKRNLSRTDQPLLSEQEFTAMFPHDIYADEDQLTHLKKSDQLAGIEFDTRNETYLRATDLKKLTPGRYLLEATSVDPYGEAVRFEKYLVVYAPENGKVPVNEYQWMVPVKTHGEPGEKAVFLIGSAATGVKVVYEIEHEKQIISREVITLNNEQKRIEIPIEEKHRGNFAVHFTYVKDNRAYTNSYTVNVPFSNKELDLKFITFRDKLLPGQEEEWKIAVSGPNKDKVMAEMVACLYDASLDAFRSNYWSLYLDKYYYQTLYWQAGEIQMQSNGYGQTLKQYITTALQYRYYEALNLFGFYLIDPYGYRGGYYGLVTDRNGLDEVVVLEESESTGENYRSGKNQQKLVPLTSTISNSDDKSNMDGVFDGEATLTSGSLLPIEKSKDSPGSSPQIRSNFSETAFFYPQLETNEKGEFIFSFKIPESLTKWKFQGLAHTRDLKVGRIEKTVVTQKDLMITAFAPRFLRENDQLVFTAKVTNLTDHDLNGTAELQLLDALTRQNVDGKMGNTGPKVQIEIKQGQSTQVQWKISVPSGLDAVTYRIIATAGDHSDGEEMTLPVLLNSMLVTESLPLPVNGMTSKTFKFEKLLSSGSSGTMRNHKLTLEFTSNPAWYAVQSLPYMMEYPYECSEQTFNRMYANSIAAHLANSDPKIKQVFDIWKNYQPNALLSNLEKNEELKNVMLEETPWVMDAKDETERKRRIAVLFDLNRMQNELAKTVRKLNQMQTPNGGWPWFEGGPDNRYITQYIISGFGHLRKIGIATNDPTVTKMISTGVQYLDNRIREDYEWLIKYKADLDKKHISQFQIQYLYARSFFTAVQVDAKNKKAFDYYLGQSKKYWLDESFYMKGMIALANSRYDDKKLAEGIIKSLKENSITNEEMGMYWKLSYGYFWYQAPVETQALLIEAFDEVADDQESVEKMKIWLLKNKQTNDWKTTKATADACYALLLKGTSQLTDDAQVIIQLGNMTINPSSDHTLKKEAGTGYFKTSWSGVEVKPEMGNIQVTKNSKGVAWGAVYWQYFEQLDKITPANTPVKITKKLFREKLTDRGPVIEPVSENVKLKVGDRVKVRVEIFCDRDMEFVHLKDMRASSFEPENVFSGYRYQDGLWYYQATKDAATHFFIDFLPKGTFVFEYPVRVTHEGSFSNGITELQCMYAPEFSSHSEGLRVSVGE